MRTSALPRTSPVSGSSQVVVSGAGSAASVTAPIRVSASSRYVARIRRSSHLQAQPCRLRAARRSHGAGARPRPSLPCGRGSTPAPGRRRRRGRGEGRSFPGRGPSFDPVADEPDGKSPAVYVRLVVDGRLVTCDDPIGRPRHTATFVEVRHIIRRCRRSTRPDEPGTLFGCPGLAGVLPEDAFVEVLEGGFSIDVIGDDRGPVVAPVAGGPLGEPLELAGCVPSVVPTTATLPLFLKIALERTREGRRTIACR